MDNDNVIKGKLVEGLKWLVGETEQNQERRSQRAIQQVNQATYKVVGALTDAVLKLEETADRVIKEYEEQADDHD